MGKIKIAASLLLYSAGMTDACKQKGMYMKNSADTEHHESIMLCARKSERHNGYYPSTPLFRYQIITLHKCKQELSNMNKCLPWERVKTFSLPDL